MKHGGFGDFGKVFENAHRMMDEMHKGMDNHFTEISMAGSGGNGLSRGQFVKQTYHKRGDDVYQTKATGAFGGGNRVVDRHQMFEN